MGSCWSSCWSCWSSCCSRCCSCGDVENDETRPLIQEPNSQGTFPVTEQPSSQKRKEVFPQLCVIEDYYVRDSTYMDGDDTRPRKKYNNAERISVEDMIGKASVAGDSLNSRSVGKRTFLIGPPGCGKTELMKSLNKLSTSNGISTWLFNCEDYAEGDNLSLEDLFYNRNDNRNIFKLKPDKCLIIFEGLDRANFKLTHVSEHVSKHIGRTTKLPFSTLISLIYKRQFLPAVQVIISSRPHAITSLSPELRPDSVVFVDNLTTEDMEMLLISRNKNGEEFLRNLKIKAAEIVYLAHTPLFLNFIQKIKDDINENSTTAEILFSMMHEFRSSKHYITKSANPDVEDKIGKIAFQKVVQGSNITKCEDLKEHGLDCENYQNLLFPAIENGGKEWYKQTDEMLNFHFIDPLILNYYTTKQMFEQEACDDFENFIRNHLFPETSKDENGKLEVEEDKLASLRKIICEYISLPKLQKSTKRKVIDEKKTLYMDVFVEKLNMIFGNEIINGQGYLLNIMRDVKDITDESMIHRLRENFNNIKFHLQFPQSFMEPEKDIVLQFFHKFVICLKHLRINCKYFDASEIEKLLELIIATKGMIEDIRLENIGKLSSKAIHDLTGKCLSKITNHVAITTADHNACKVMKDRMENVAHKNWDWKESSLERGTSEITLTKRSDSYLAAKSVKLFVTDLISPAVKTVDTVLKRISTKVQQEARKKLKELCGQHHQVEAVHPEVKYIEDFRSTEIFDPGNTKVYDVEPYSKIEEIQKSPGKETTILETLVEFTRTMKNKGKSAVLIGSKGSGKTILGNQMITYYKPDKQFSMLINLDNFDEQQEIGLKEVLIDMPAVKDGNFDKQECEVAFQWIVENPSKCNIILDNYDRASFKLTTFPSPDVMKPMKPGELFGNLFAKLLLPEANILFISRPYAITQLPLDQCPNSLYFVRNLSEENIMSLFDRFSGKQREEKRNYIDQHFPLAWKLCRNPQMLHILANLAKLDQTRNFFDLIDEVCFQFNGDDQESRENSIVMNSNRLKYLAYTASSDSSITLITDAASKNIQAVEGMMLVKPCEKRNKSEIQSHFINPLIQDHYAARYIKERPYAEEVLVRNFIDEKLFPSSNGNDGEHARRLKKESDEMPTFNEERFHLIRRLCCSNTSGREKIQPYFWRKMKESIQEQVNRQEESSSREKNIDLILDLMEIFAEGKRTKEAERKKESGRAVPGSEYSVQQLCNELKQMRIEFSNLDFTSIHEVNGICKLVEYCTIKKVKCVTINGRTTTNNEKITNEDFGRICAMLKKSKLKVDKLYILHTDELDVMALKRIKGIIELVKEEILIGTNDPTKAYELHKNLKKEVLRKGLKIEIEDEYEGPPRYEKYVIAKGRKN